MPAARNESMAAFDDDGRAEHQSMFGPDARATASDRPDWSAVVRPRPSDRKTAGRLTVEAESSRSTDPRRSRDAHVRLPRIPPCQKIPDVRCNLSARRVLRPDGLPSEKP